jgi:hypothetical protein
VDYAKLPRHGRQFQKASHHESVHSAMPKHRPSVPCNMDDDAVTFPEREIVGLVPRSQPPLGSNGLEYRVEMLVTTDDVVECM